jgi:hypothetical protein
MDGQRRAFKCVVFPGEKQQVAAAAKTASRKYQVRSDPEQGLNNEIAQYTLMQCAETPLSKVRCQAKLKRGRPADECPINKGGP